MWNYSEPRPCFTGVQNYKVTITIAGSGSISGWTFTAEMRKPDGTSAGAATAAVSDAVNRKVLLTAPGQTVAGRYPALVRRTDDSSQDVVWHGALDVAEFALWQRTKLRVASGLRITDPSTMKEDWDKVIAAATIDAENDVKAQLALKGYTPAQIAAADQLRDWIERQGAFHSFVNATALANYSLESVNHLDMIGEDPSEGRLAKMGVILIGGVPTAPASGGSEVGGISSGGITEVDEWEDEKDLFI